MDGHQSPEKGGEGRGGVEEVRKRDKGVSPPRSPHSGEISETFTSARRGRGGSAVQTELWILFQA